MKSIIIGFGEIGKSLYNVLSSNYPVSVHDNKSSVSCTADSQTYDIMHICFPYSEKFVEYAKEYQAKYKPKYTIIHSTVPPEVYDSVEAISSPCLGIHPFLEESMKTFPKYLGGKQASQVADYFRRAGMKVYLVDDPKAPAIMKILDTTFYATCIEYVKDVKRQCDKFGISFDLWTVWTKNYNEGYKKLGYNEFIRPDLVPIMQKQGGHCTLPNLDLMNTPFTKFIKELND